MPPRLLSFHFPTPPEIAVSVDNGLGDLPQLKQSAVLQAVSSTVSACRNGWSDQEMADEWDVSAGTVNNATNKKHEVSLSNWLKLGRRFGPEGLNTALALVRMKAVHLTAVVVDVAKVPFEVASTLPLLIQLLGDGECCDDDVRKLEKAGAIEAILKTAAYLRQRRDEVRLKD
jgi:hypothetical protein